MLVPANPTTMRRIAECAFYGFGAETPVLTSATLDLSILTAADWPTLLTKPYSDIENTQTPRDPAGWVMAQILPAYMAGAASQPQFIPLEFLASLLYPERSKRVFMMKSATVNT